MSLAIAVLFGHKVVTLDVVTAFLIPSLPDDQVIYIEPPPFMGLPKNVVLRLCKALYGIRQAANLWFKHLKQSMQALDLHPCPADPCLFTNGGPPEALVAVAVHVDDFTIVAPADRVEGVIAGLRRIYRMTGGGVPTWLLGMKVECVPGCIKLLQGDFIDQMLVHVSA